MKDLGELREEIDAVDRQLTDLFALRMDLCGQVAQYKSARGMAIYAPEREARVLEALEGKTTPEMLPYTRRLFQTLMDLSKEYQRELLGQK
mgnify:CR=1 FL=1